MLNPRKLVGCLFDFIIYELLKLSIASERSYAAASAGPNTDEWIKSE